MRALSVGLRLKEGATQADRAAVADGLESWARKPPIESSRVVFLPDAEHALNGLRNGKRDAALKIEAPELTEAAVCAAFKQSDWGAYLDDDIDIHGFDWSISSCKPAWE